MSNYAPYYNQNNPSRPPMPQQQQSAQNQPTSSTWTSTISSRFANFTKFLSRDSEQDDPEDENCSHVSNVLRAYYTERGRQFPSWLPPDPKKPQRQQQYQAQQAQYGYGQYENAYGNPNMNPTHSRGGSGGGALNDIFADTRTQQQQQPPPTQSLRAPRPSAPTMRSSDSSGASRLNPPGPSFGSQQVSGARPLPSQRAGSFQNQNPPPANAPPVSSRDRLKFKVGGGGGSGRNSPAANQSGQNTYGDAGNASIVSSSSASQPWSNSGGYDNYGTGRENRGYGNRAYQ